MTGNDCSECKKKVDALIANTANKWGEEDREYLMGLEETTLDKIVPVTKAPETNGKGSDEEEQQVPQLNENQKKVLDMLTNKDAKVEDVLGIFPEEIGEQLKTGLALHKKQRAELIKRIVANSGDVWDEETLKGMKTEMLEKISKTIPQPVDYSLNGDFDGGDDGGEKASTPMKPTAYNVTKKESK